MLCKQYCSCNVSYLGSYPYHQGSVVFFEFLSPICNIQVAFLTMMCSRQAVTFCGGCSRGRWSEVTTKSIPSSPGAAAPHTNSYRLLRNLPRSVIPGYQLYRQEIKPHHRPDDKCTTPNAKELITLATLYRA